jgi:AcrR family transcriptional regulator
MTQPIPTKRQQQAAATQEQLLCAARDVFGDRGYQGTTVGAITTRANTAHGTFYLYFRNKQDAFAAVMAGITDEVYREAERGAGAEDPRTAIRESIRGFLEAFVEHRRLWRCLIEGAFTNAEVEVVWLEIRSRFVERVERDLRAFGTSLDPALAANALGGMVEWAAITQFVLEAPQVAGRSTSDTVDVLTDLWVGAVLATGAPTPTR